MSRNGTLLPIPEGSDTANFVALLVAEWEAGTWAHLDWPRSRWLAEVERGLKIVYPQSSSADRKLTARHYAPFPLALGPDVP